MPDTFRPVLLGYSDEVRRFVPLPRTVYLVKECNCEYYETGLNICHLEIGITAPRCPEIAISGDRKTAPNTFIR